MNTTTKKLQKLVKQRKTKIVVTERGSVKHYSRPSSGSSTSDYYIGSLDDD